VDFKVSTLQGAHKFCRLICGNPAGDPHRYSHESIVERLDVGLIFYTALLEVLLYQKFVALSSLWQESRMLKTISQALNPVSYHQQITARL
jgi:hypothetical protein